MPTARTLLLTLLLSCAVSPAFTLLLPPSSSITGRSISSRSTSSHCRLPSFVRSGALRASSGDHHDVIIIGSGVAGLSCANSLLSPSDSPSSSPPSVLVLESSSTPGGRVATDAFTAPEGTYLLDRAFAVFITSYPASLATLDYPSLDLKAFEPGSLVLTDKGTISKVCDPLRRPLTLLAAVTSPVGSLLDKVKVALLLLRCFTTSVPELFQAPETSTREMLRDKYGFSEKFVDQFFRPFLEGIYLADVSEGVGVGVREWE